METLYIGINDAVDNDEMDCLDYINQERPTYDLIAFDNKGKTYLIEVVKR